MSGGRTLMATRRSSDFLPALYDRPHAPLTQQLENLDLWDQVCELLRCGRNEPAGGVLPPMDRSGSLSVGF